MGPSMKCAACAKFLASAVAVHCALCPCVYHRGCVAIPDSAAVVKDWACPECKKKQKRTDNSSTPVRTAYGNQGGTSSAPPAGPAGNASPEGTTPWVMPLELSTYIAEQREFRSEMRAALRDMGARMDDMERRLAAVEQRAEAVPASAPAPGGAEVDELRRSVARLQSELAERDQDALLADLDIGQLPEERGENAVHVVTVLAAKLGVSLEPRDVVFAERVGAPSAAGAGAGAGAPAMGRRLVVRLARRELRDELLRAARVRRGLSSRDAGQAGAGAGGERRVYVNERLTRANRLLFHRVREECRKRQWRYSWTKRGRVYARRADGTQAYCLRSEEDLLRVFGDGAV